MADSKTTFLKIANSQYFFASFPWKQVKVYWLARMGQNFDQAKRDNTFWPRPNILHPSVVTKIALLNNQFKLLRCQILSRFINLPKNRYLDIAEMNNQTDWNWQKNIFEPTQIHTSFKVIGYHLGWNFCPHQCCILFSIQNQTEAEIMNLEPQKCHLRAEVGRT